METKYIFITGGVCSSLGKGIAAASLGALLESHGFKVTIQKMDPYINVDPGTMSPFQHGEVYVTDDGAETDLDLGNYERFTSSPISKSNSITTGQIYLTVIERERKGEYLGRTVQVIPHITNEIKKRILKLKKEASPDIIIVEIGGTVGDIESIPFLEAIRQFPFDVGKENVLFIHLTLVPSITAAGEQKTKPTQHSVKELREIGIQPDVLMCRASKELSDDMKEKLALFCNVERQAVIEALDASVSVYEIPLQYSKAGLDDTVISKLKLIPPKNRDMNAWEKIINTLKSPAKKVKIAVVGKYISLQDSYKSVYEAIIHGGIANDCYVEILKFNSEDFIDHPGLTNEFFDDVDGVLIPGGFGERGVEGKINVLKYTRERHIPTFGVCLGMQCMVIEFARNVLGWEGANSTEFHLDTKFPVISLLSEQKDVTELGGTMRLGAYEAKLNSGTKIHSIYNSDIISERHRHRFEFTYKYKTSYQNAGFIISSESESEGLVETVELQQHPWYIGVQFHPEFKSKPAKPHPLFISFVEHALSYAENRQYKSASEHELIA